MTNHTVLNSILDFNGWALIAIVIIFVVTALISKP